MSAAPAASGAPRPSRERQLWRRQERLLARSAVLRERLGTDLATLQAPLALVDTAVDAARWVRAHRELVGAGAVLLALLRPRRTLRWVGRGWGLWRVGRRLWPLLVRLALRHLSAGAPPGRRER